MIVYGRQLKIDDIKSLDTDEELIFYRDNNIAFTINQLSNNNYILRKKKIFNNQLVDERMVKTAEQVVKIID